MFDFGLNDAMTPIPPEVQQLQGKPPANEQEFAIRKQEWKTALEGLNKDPNFLRAMAVMGLNLMQPGANFGSAGLAGLSAYEAGKQADLEQQEKQRMAERQDKQDRRAEESHRLQQEVSQENLAYNREKRPLEVRKLTEELDAAPQERELRIQQLRQQIQQSRASIANMAADNDRAAARLKMEQELRPLQLELQREQIAATKESKKTAQEQRVTDQERFIRSAMEDPSLALDERGMPRPEPVRRRLATKQYMEMSRGMATGMRLGAKEQEAVAFYETVEALPEETKAYKMATMTPQEFILYGQGRQLMEENQSGSSAPTSSAPTKPRVIDAATIRQQLQGK